MTVRIGTGRIGFGFLVLLLAISNAEARDEPFTLVSTAAVVNPATQDVAFTIEFNQPPDFFTLDQFGHPRHSFQYFILGDLSLISPYLYAAIIRGDEVHFVQNMLRVRNSAPSSPDAASGGWGTLRGDVPFSLKGKRLTFSAPLDLINVQKRSGNLSYQLMSLEYGASTGIVTKGLGESDEIIELPLPGSSLAEPSASRYLLYLPLLGR